MPQLSDEKVRRIVAALTGKFHTFGGGRVADASNPLCHAFKDEPVAFAMGVNVEQVVREVLSMNADDPAAHTKSEIIGQADCGCVHHAEDGVACVHDIELAENAGRR